MSPPAKKVRQRRSLRGANVSTEEMETSPHASDAEMSAEEPQSDNSFDGEDKPKKQQKKKKKVAPKKDEVVVTPPVEEGGEAKDASVLNVEMDDDEEEGGIRIGDIYLPPPPPPACTFDSNGPRLVISYIENDFFKSYAGKQVLGPFHKSFSSVVGPNGSGKSNVIDGMLFVFGYRAQKTRSKKISNLIHNSEAYPNVQSCTVAVHFEKIIDKSDDDFEVVPDTKLVVARTAYKDNSSFYTINGKKFQFKAVAKLLRAEGIDLDHNRFLILQGEVEQISMMKPKGMTEHESGMLEYLEDIVGSTRFKEPIELLAKRVELLNEQREEKLNRVKMVEKEKDELEGPKNIAISYIKQENEITQKKNVLYQGFLHNFNIEKTNAEAKKTEIDEGLTEVRQKLADLNEKKVEKESSMKEIGAEQESVLTAKGEAGTKFKELEIEDKQIQEDMKHKNQKRKKVIAQLKTEKEKLEDLQKQPEKNETDISECIKLKENHEEKRKKEEDAYAKAMESISSETQQLQEEKKTHETKLIDLRKAVDETKGVLDIAQSELDIYLSNEKEAKKKLENVKNSLEKAKDTIVTRKEEISRLETALPEYQTKKSTAEKDLQKIVPELAKVERDLNSERVKLEESRSSMQNMRSRGRVQDAIMEQKKNGNIPGIFGRLGDLGGIDEKYDVAISTACGPLDNIVVDSVETGQACINFLKRTNTGLATFIALDKMEKWREHSQRPMQTPENVPRLFDLIKVQDERVKTAFYFANRDTLVAKDLDQASRIAYGRVRHRVVTLKGELIEPSGAMTGGGRSVLRGRMGQSAQAVVTVDPKDVQQTENNVEQLTQRAMQLRRQKAETENLLQTTTKDCEVMKMNQEKYAMEIKALEEQIHSLTKQEGEHEKYVEKVKSDPIKVKSLEEVIEGRQSAYKEAAGNAEGVETEVAKIHKQIVAITGGKMKGLKKSLNEINNKIDKLDEEITRLKVASKTAARKTTKTEEKLESLEAEKKELEEDMKAMAQRKSAIEEQASEVLNNLEEVTTKENTLRESLADLKKLYDEFVKQENAIKSSKIEIDQEIEKYETIVKESRAKISHWKKKLSKLELQEVPLSSESPEEGNTLKELSEEELSELDTKQLEYDLELLEQQIEQTRPNLAVIQEYRKKEDVYLQRVAELDQITSSRDDQRKHHDNLRKQRLNEFMSGFSIISNKLKEMYQMITLGGDAELELVDSLDPFSEGIVFSVRPPKKSWKNITNLSGGEKTLSSLALVFALHYYKPTPLYVMDEIDAALDFKNVSIVANYIKERTKNAQFIIISLRSQMFELADRLVGIYKTYNCTKTVTINPKIYDEQQAPPTTMDAPPASSADAPPISSQGQAVTLAS